MKRSIVLKFVCFAFVLTLLCTMSITSIAAEYTYESEFAKLPDEVKAMENILLVDDMEAISENLALSSSPVYLYGDAWFTGSSGGMLALDFEGTTIGLLAQKGAFDIYIDDEFVETVWVTANAGGSPQLVYFINQLENDYHTIYAVTNLEIASEKTPEPYSVFSGFIVQKEVEPIPTAIPTEDPTQAPVTETPTTEAPITDIPATQAPGNSDSGCGKSSAIAQIMIILGAALVIRNKK